MKISKIYEKYKIPAFLQLHQLRVASLALEIVRNIDVDIDLDRVLKLTLLHDMGNIVKFRFDIFEESYEKEGIEYWKTVQSEFINKYGSNSHEVTHQIVLEIGLSEEFANEIGMLHIKRSKEVLDSINYITMIANYADKRISPTGIVPLHERLKEALDRRGRTLDEYSQEMAALGEIELILQKSCLIDLNCISDSDLKNNFEYLKNYEII